MDIFVQGGCGPEYVTETVQDTYLEFAAHHYELAAERMTDPRDDLISLWLKARIDGEPMTEDEILFEHTMILVGGSETTRNAISGGLYELIRDPEQWEWLRAHPEAIPNACEEMTRWVTPFINMSRTVTRDVEFRDKTLRKGEELIMLYPAANRDPRAFENPDTFDVRRRFDRKPVAFGYGRHHCLGANLARVEMKVLYEELFRAVSKVEFAGEPTFRMSSFIRRPKTLPVRFTPA